MALFIASSLCRNAARASFRACNINSATFSTRSYRSSTFSLTSIIKKSVRVDKLKSSLKLQHKSYPLISFGAVAVAAVLKAKGILPTAYCGLKLSHKNVALSKSKETSIKEEPKPSPKFDFKEFFKLLLPDIWLLMLASISAFAVAMTNIHLPLLLGNLVNVVSNLTSEDHARDYFEVLKKPAMQLFGLYMAQAGLTFVYISMLSCLGERLAERMRTALFASLIRQDIAFFDLHKTGELINRLTADVQDFKSSFKQCISQGLKSSTQVIGCVFTMYYISPKLTGVTVIIVPAVIVIGTLFGSLLRRLSRKAQEQVAKATSVADEALGNVRTVRAFAMERKETDLYSKEVSKSKMLNELLGVGIGAFQGGANFAINGLVLIVLYAGGSMLAVRELQPGDLMSFLVATQTIQRSLGSISVLFGQVIRGMSAGARVFEYLTIKPTIPVAGGKTLPISNIKGQVEFENITFSYPTRKGHVVLKNFSLSIEKGTMVALCGPSGSGKSTVAALLERFYEVGIGQVTLDGYNIKDLDPTWMRGAVIGYIHQFPHDQPVCWSGSLHLPSIRYSNDWFDSRDSLFVEMILIDVFVVFLAFSFAKPYFFPYMKEPILFATSIMENIRYGKPNATDNEVYEAAKLSNADGFIRQFPEGYDTVLGERGITVSGGQRQRIAIARALLKNPAILILDEATSALDAESERLVQQALDRLTEGRTVIVIAHRLSTIQGADKIVVLSHGKIQELGTHQQLMKKKGLYAELVRRQMQDEDDDDDDDD